MTEIIRDISINSMYLSVLAGLVFFKKLNKLQKIFFGYVVYLVLLEYINHWAIHELRNNIWLMDLTLSIDFLFFIMIYNQWSKFSKLELRGYSIVFAYLILSLVIKYLVFNSFKDINYILPVMMITAILISGNVILKTFDNNNTEFHKSFVFWISFSRLFYYMMILPFNIYHYIELQLDKEVADTYYAADRVINYIANFVLNVLYAYSFTCRK
ncbi:MAG TPA: hypothetical protein VGF79_16175 [Bacteroidia bacterium]